MLLLHAPHARASPPVTHPKSNRASYAAVPESELPVVSCVTAPIPPALSSCDPISLRGHPSSLHPASGPGASSAVHIGSSCPKLGKPSLRLPRRGPPSLPRHSMSGMHDWRAIQRGCSSAKRQPMSSPCPDGLWPTVMPNPPPWFAVPSIPHPIPSPISHVWASLSRRRLRFFLNPALLCVTNCQAFRFQKLAEPCTHSSSNPRCLNFRLEELSGCLLVPKCSSPYCRIVRTV